MSLVGLLEATTPGAVPLSSGYLLYSWLSRSLSGEVTLHSGGEAPAVGGLWAGLDRKRRQVPLGLLLRHAVRYRQLGEVLAHFVEDLLGRDDDEARFVEDALGGLAGGRREKDVSVRGDAS